MSKAVSRSLRVALSVAIIAGLVLFARKVNWSTTWEKITEANLTILLAAAVVNLLSLALKGVRWWIFLRPAGVPSLWLAIRATFAGAGLNNILVANGGEAARVVFVARAAHVQSAKILASLALERMFELIGYIVMFVLAVSFLELPHWLSRARRTSTSHWSAPSRRCWRSTPGLRFARPRATSACFRRSMHSRRQPSAWTVTRRSPSRFSSRHSKSFR